jgi:hypothetical protein
MDQETSLLVLAAWETNRALRRKQTNHWREVPQVKKAFVLAACIILASQHWHAALSKV